MAKSKRPDLDVKFKHYPNARETKGLVTKIEEFAPTRETQFSGSLQEIEAWVATQHNARIVLHPRAVRGLKKSAFQEVGLVYAALQLLAREYWHMRTATPQQAAANARAFNDKLANLGLELSPTISSSRAGEQGDEYFVKFPVGSDKKELLDLHLKKGVAHDERLCLRIYFFWYAPGQIIVIGWLTGHLDTRAS